MQGIFIATRSMSRDALRPKIPFLRETSFDRTADELPSVTLFLEEDDSRRYRSLILVELNSNFAPRRSHCVRMVRYKFHLFITIWIICKVDSFMASTVLYTLSI